MMLTCDAPGMRLDQFLALRRPQTSRSHWKSLIEKGTVSVDGRKRSADYKLSEGEKIRVEALENSWASADSLDGLVLHEDSQLNCSEHEARPAR